jgi:hypothetical protein
VRIYWIGCEAGSSGAALNLATGRTSHYSSHLAANSIFCNLCHTYIPTWLKTGDISAARLREFYHDPAKRNVDRQALHDASYRRAVSTQTSLRWQVHRKRVEVADHLRSIWMKLPPSIGMLHAGDRTGLRGR